MFCRTKKPKGELFRFLVNKDKTIVFDKTQKIQGRGFYICSEKCWENARAKKRKIRFGSDARTAIGVSLPEKAFEDVVNV